MKVYHRKVLFLTLIIGFGGIVYFGGRFLQGDTLGIVWMIIFAILTKQGLSIALTEKGSAQEAARVQTSREMYSELFGKFGKVMPYGTVILYCIGIVCIYFIPTQIWLGLCFLIGAAAYYLWLIWTMKKFLEKKNK